MSSSRSPLLVGEVFVDFTVTETGVENKLRLGGIVHAARGFWALNKPFSVAMVLPEYLEQSARKYLEALGCVDCHIIGRVRGAPNVMAIFDATEVGDQHYETLLRDEKNVELLPVDLRNAGYRDILIFPGSYDLSQVCAMFSHTARLHLDVAYDVSDPTALARLPQQIETVFTSTSSPLFKSLASQELCDLFKVFETCAPAILVLKENRGGARMVTAGTKQVEALPAQLGSTTNSVGVGDVFAAAFVVHGGRGQSEAGWRATYAASAYSQTTDPDLFKAYVQRDLKLELTEMKQNWGVFLPWEYRQKHEIYLAGPDFSYADRRAIEEAVASLRYHNFRIRRPVVEIGELPVDSDLTQLKQTYQSDYALLKQCALVFAVPTGGDAGTLVELGIAIEAGIPTVVYDPSGENTNTMVIAGANYYSANLDECLNAVFRILSEAAPQ